MKNNSGVQGDWITNDTKPVFSGSFGSYAFDSTQGQITFQLLDASGKLINSASPILTKDNKWSSPTDLTGSGLNEGIYYSRVLITDKAGNIVSTDFQKFIIDTEVTKSSAADSLFKYTTGSTNVETVKSIKDFYVKPGEKVTYSIFDGNSEITKGVYEGAELVVKDPSGNNLTLNKTFAAGQFKITLTDESGNSISETNTGVSWSFTNQNILFSGSPVQSTDTQKAGAVGSYLLPKIALFDLGELPKTGDELIHNEISMTDNGVQQLALRLNDVLNLGATNSFDTANHVQMRIKGDTQNGAQDKVTLIDSAVWTKTGMSVSLDDNIQYQVFTANNGTVDLFVQSGLQIYKSDGTLFMV